MDDESAQRRQRRNEQNSAYAKELEAQISNNKRRRDREKLEQEARERREEEQVVRERAQPGRRGGGGEPIRNADGNVVTQLHLLKDANGDMVPPTGGELLERTKLQVPPQPRGRDLIERTKPGAFDQRFGVTGGGPVLLSGNGRDDVHLLVVCTAERGLCGAFNSSIVRLARERAGRGQQGVR